MKLLISFALMMTSVFGQGFIVCQDLVRGTVTGVVKINDVTVHGQPRKMLTIGINSGYVFDDTNPGGPTTVTLNGKKVTIADLEKIQGTVTVSYYSDVPNGKCGGRSGGTGVFVRVNVVSSSKK